MVSINKLALGEKHMQRLKPKNEKKTTMLLLILAKNSPKAAVWNFSHLDKISHASLLPKYHDTLQCTSCMEENLTGGSRKYIYCGVHGTCIVLIFYYFLKMEFVIIVLFGYTFDLKHSFL